MNPIAEIASRYQSILRRIAGAAQSQGHARAVTLVAVSKTQPADAIEALYRLGHRDFGENYVQELVAKAEELAHRGCTEIRWHFIGHLQTNKVKALLPYVASVHSVNSEKLALELAKRWAASGRTGKLPVFIEVNISGEDTKAGLSPDEIPALARKIGEMPGLELLGLMCIPDPELPESELRGHFKGLRELEEKCRPWSKGRLSMGMSGDFELALAEGATDVRVGTALFGPRQAAPAPAGEQ